MGKIVTLEFCSIQQDSRTSNDIGMKLGPVTKLEKTKKTKSRMFDVDIMSENCHIVVIFCFFGQFGAVGRPDSKSYVFSNSDLLCYETASGNLRQVSHHCFE